MKKYSLSLKDICRQGNSGSALEDLYWYYFTEHPVDTAEIKKRFSELEGILNQLTMDDHDRVWNLACFLCIEHEKRGFLEGAAMGGTLVAELLGERR